MRVDLPNFAQDRDESLTMVVPNKSFLLKGLAYGCTFIQGVKARPALAYRANLLSSLIQAQRSSSLEEFLPVPDIKTASFHRGTATTIRSIRALRQGGYLVAIRPELDPHLLPLPTIAVAILKGISDKFGFRYISDEAWAVLISEVQEAFPPGDFDPDRFQRVHQLCAPFYQIPPTFEKILALEMGLATQLTLP